MGRRGHSHRSREATSQAAHVKDAPSPTRSACKAADHKRVSEKEAGGVKIEKEYSE